jgi:pilus assembly protein FimV
LKKPGAFNRMNRFSHLMVCLFGLIGLSGLSLSAQALTLAGIEVQSNKGEPLRAEVSLASVSADEWAQLAVRIAPAERFAQLGLVYTPAVGQLQVELIETTDGVKRIRVSGAPIFSDNFVDLLIEAQTASGKWVKAFTLMLKSAPSKTEAPLQLPAASSNLKAAPQLSAQHVVQKGESASQIIQKWLTEDMGTQQMLVALLKNQPDAFIEGNVNLLRAGAVLKAPTPTAVRAIDAEEARKFLVVQQKEFLAFSQAAAQNTQLVKGQLPSRQISGKVAQVESPSPQADQSIDQLKLTQAKIEKQNEESRLAAQRALQDAQKQLEALQNNVNQLIQLTAPAAQASAMVSGEKASLSDAGSGWLNLNRLLASTHKNSYLWAALTLLGVLAVWAGLRSQSRKNSQTLSTLTPAPSGKIQSTGFDTPSQRALPADITALNLDLHPQSLKARSGFQSPAPTETLQ